MQLLKATKLGPWWKFWRKHKYRLDETYIHKTALCSHTIDMKYVKLTKEGYLIVMMGYCWDGASGPTWDTRSCRRGSMAHDALYQLIRDGGLSRGYKRYADELLRDICIQDGMLRVRAWAWFHAVRLFGGRYLKCSI